MGRVGLVQQYGPQMAHVQYPVRRDMEISAAKLAGGLPSGFKPILSASRVIQEGEIEASVQPQVQRVEKVKHGKGRPSMLSICLGRHAAGMQPGKLLRPSTPC